MLEENLIFVSFTRSIIILSHQHVNHIDFDVLTEYYIDLRCFCTEIIVFDCHG